MDIQMSTIGSADVLLLDRYVRSVDNRERSCKG